MTRNYDFIDGGHAPIKSWTRHVPFEEEAKQQIRNLAAMPFIKGVAVMPDVHLGIGSSVGTVAAMRGAVIPAIVGVDIGCGMIASKTNLMAKDLPDNLHALRTELERVIPHGRTEGGKSGDRGAWHDVPYHLANFWKDNFEIPYNRITDKHPKSKAYNTANHIGTLGSGNHFVEVCLDETDAVWIMLHSGSRGLGNKFGQYFIEAAKEEMQRYFISIADKDLSYLVEGTEIYDDYIRAVHLAQDFAAVNRSFMMGSALSALSLIMKRFIDVQDNAVNCHHNYISRENFGGQNFIVTRKGAVSARKGQLGIIPGSMGAKSFIVRGLGNEESFCSCSHGAGRVMSRTEARKSITLEQHANDTRGVECRKDVEVLDESPKAYKSIDDVMRSQADLVEIVATLKQVLCVKG